MRLRSPPRWFLRGFSLWRSFVLLTLLFPLAEKMKPWWLFCELLWQFVVIGVLKALKNLRHIFSFVKYVRGDLSDLLNVNSQVMPMLNGFNPSKRRNSGSWSEVNLDRNEIFIRRRPNIVNKSIPSVFRR